MIWGRSGVVRRGGDPRRAARGQGLVEFTMLVPVFLLLLLGMLEFGFAFDQNLTLEYATREGARVGAALANDGGPAVCDPATTDVDDQIVAAVRRVLLSPGSRVTPAIGMEVRIWKADASGAPTGGINVWQYTGPGTGPEVDTQRIGFTQVSQPWSPCNRKNGGTGGPDSIGVSLAHTYTFQTPLAGIVRFVGGASAGTLTMSDRTVMALNPTD